MPALVAITISSRRDDVADQPADQLLGRAVAVPGRGVDQRAAGLGEGDQLVAGLVLVGVATPRHGAQAEPRDREARGDRPPAVACAQTVAASAGAPGCLRLAARSQALAWVAPAAAPDAGKQPMNYFDAVILGIVEGLTEFLPISSTGHLTIAEKMLGLEVDDPAVTGFTAVIQMGAIAAVDPLLRPRHLARSSGPGCVGLVKPECRGHRDFRMGWYVIVGTIPVGIVGLRVQGRHQGRPALLWVVAVALIVWSAVMWAAERVAPPGPRREAAEPDRRDRGRPRPVRRADPRRLAVGRDDLGRPVPRARPGHRDPALASSSPSRPCWRPGSSSSRTPSAATSASARPSSGPSWRSSSPTPRSPGCCSFVAHHPITWFVPYRVGAGRAAARRCWPAA